MYKQTFPAPRGHTKPAPYFVQGTTPVFSYTVTGDDGEPVSMSSAKKIEVTFSQGGSYSADEKKLTVEIDPARCKSVSWTQPGTPGQRWQKILRSPCTSS